MVDLVGGHVTPLLLAN
jgi:hypothetical protein